MQNVKLRLDAWRDAMRRRDALARGSPDWQEAEADVRQAEKLFHAELAQAAARYSEEEFQDQYGRRFPEPDRRTVRADDGPDDGVLGRSRDG